MLMKINLNLNKTHVKSNKSYAFHSIFSFSILPIFTEKKQVFLPLLENFNSEYLFRFCKKKKNETNENRSRVLV